jgi:hypothetical protein
MSSLQRASIPSTASAMAACPCTRPWDTRRRRVWPRLGCVVLLTRQMGALRQSAHQQPTATYHNVVSATISPAHRAA